MPVEPNDILIFKMRGRKAPKKQAARAVVAVRETTPQVQAPKQERKPFFAPKPKIAKAPTPAPMSAPEPVRARAQEQVQVPEMPTPPKETPLSEDEEERLREIRNLEDMALYAAPVEGSAAGKVQANAFIKVAGTFFLINAVLFAYFIMPQLYFVLSYLSNVGIAAFVLSWNYEYGTALVNISLALLSAATGAILFANIRRSHLLGGIAGAMLLLVVSYEYLNSSATYLLLVTLLSFVSIASLVYARMSAVIVTESEMPTPAQINWPRIETF